MEHSKKLIVITSVILFFSLFACKNKTSKPNPDLATIDLLRGELLLCGTESFGEVNFSLSCSYETRETFDLALSLLHSFEYAEAEKAFVQVLDADPECVMAYWGVAMSIYHSIWMQRDLSYLKKGEKLLKLANKLPKSDLEKDYLDAIGVFYKDWESIDKTTRKRMYEKKMEELYNKHEGDAEAAVFYALAILAAADPNDTTYARQKKSGKILEELFVEKPNHPGIAHYIIHNYDYPELAQMALNTARRYAEIAPASAHAQHMPSHIFTRLGLWEESVQTNLRSASAAKCYSESSNKEGHLAGETHALDYLLYAYLQQGDDKKANEQYDYIKGIKKVWGNNASLAYAFAAIPARMALENKDWAGAATLQTTVVELTWEEFPWQKSIIHFTRAIGSAHLGDLVSAEAELTILKTLQQELVQLEDTYKAKQVMIQVKASEAWIQLAKGNNAEALALMKKSAELENQTTKPGVTPGEVLPADELLGDMLLALNRPLQALEAYEVNLKGHPNRFNGIYGAALAAKQSGSKEKATTYFKALLKLTENSNSGRPEIKEAKAFLENNSI